MANDIFIGIGEPGDIGGKALALYRLSEAGFQIPRWFAVRPSAFFSCLKKAQQSDLDAADDVELTNGLAAQIAAAMEGLSGEYFAVRSSAVSEDSAESSFAGQYDSFLYVRREEIAGAVKRVWGSRLSDRMREYRTLIKAEGPAEVPAVIVQEMIAADCAGVAFAADPTGFDVGRAVVSGVYGLGSSLVDGEAAADVYYVDRADLAVESALARKDVMHRYENGAVRPVPVPPKLTQKPVLSESQAVQVAKLAWETSAAFGKYQDIEWAFQAGELYLLQSRPITTMPDTVEQKGRAVLFDNSNIAESYGGVTLPLTFSFIQMVYAAVYEQFCRLFGVSEQVIEQNAGTFQCMLASADGRVYYNLLSWYQMLSLLPGFGSNQKFMEQMMGVREGLPQEFLETLTAKKTASKATDRLRLLKSGVKIIGRYFRLEGSIRRFYARLDDALGGDPIEAMRNDQVRGHFRLIESKLLYHWDAPLENDFFAMIFHGLLKSLSEKWIGVDGIHNDLLSGQGGIISAQPARMVQRIADAVRGDAQLVEGLRSGHVGGVRRTLKKRPDVAAMIEEYMERFSDRCLNELKLESETISDNPSLFYQSVGVLAAREKAVLPDPDELAEKARQKAMEKLRGRPVRRLVYGYVLKNAKRLIKNRENMRFERTRLFGCVRRMMKQAGINLASAGVIGEQKDVFYLKLDEIFGYIDGTSPSADLKLTVAARKSEYGRYLAMDDPPGRFMTRGSAMNPNRILTGGGNALPVREGDVLTGLACCAGVYRGRACVVEDPARANLGEGDVLVAAHTDPGWIMLFGLAGAVVIERGSLLSHAAIVSREMGLPSVVSAENATKLIKNGDLLLVDGSRGTVAILKE